MPKLYPVFTLNANLNPNAIMGRGDTLNFFGFFRSEDRAKALVDYMKRSYDQEGLWFGQSTYARVKDIAYVERDDTNTHRFMNSRLGIEYNREQPDDYDSIRLLPPSGYIAWSTASIGQLLTNLDRLGGKLAYSVRFDDVFDGVNVSLISNPIHEISENGNPYYDHIVAADDYDEAIQKAFAKVYV